MKEFIGWASSLVLMFTICWQVYKQWQKGTSEGVSTWLFVGQILSSIGFSIYSWLVGNMVFVVTNALLLLSAIVGLSVVLYHRRREGNQNSSTATNNSPPENTAAESRAIK
jgi:MtN3 and saliva related transmembrane protein